MNEELKKYIKEARLKDQDKANSNYALTTLPLDINVMYDGTGGVVLYPEKNTTKSYLGKMDENTFISYREELKQLFKDIDYILEKINKKYKLKLK